MFVTLLVLKEDTSSDVNDVQLKNMRLMLVTLLVLNEDKSSDVNDEQLRNI